MIMEHTLIWEEHFQTLVNKLWNFYSQKELNDFTLITYSNYHLVHNIVLRAASPIFDTLWKNKSESGFINNSLYLIPPAEDEANIDFELFVKLSYLGEVTVEENALDNLYRAGQLLRAHMLVEFDREKVEKNVFKFRWTCHKIRLSEHLKNQMKDKMHSDIIFVTEDKCNVYGQCSVVSCFSPVILKISKNHDMKSPLTVLLPGITSRTVKLVLEFLCTGEITLKSKDVFPVLQFSKLLNIQFLVEKISTIQNLSDKHTGESSGNTFLVHSRDQNVLKLLNDIRKSAKRFTDITFYCEGKILQAHSNVLYLHSPCIRKLLDKTEGFRNSVVLVNDLNMKELETVLDCIYGVRDINYPASLMKKLIDCQWLADDIITCKKNDETDGKVSSHLEESDEDVDDPQPIENEERITQDEIDTPQNESRENESESPRISRNPDAVMVNCELEQEIEDVSTIINTSRNQTDDSQNLPTISSNVSVDKSSDSTDAALNERPGSTKKPLLEPLHSCNTCGSAFYSHKSFREHIVQIHPDGKIMKCSFCNKGFVKKSLLQMHLRSHTGIRPYSCKECGSTFTLKSALKKHLLIHTKGKEESCEFCGKKFVRKEYLEEHRRTHTGSKPYKCDICEKSFVGKTGLNHHRATHLDKKKTWVCEICGKAFSRHTLWTHVKTHEKDHACIICEKRFSTSTILQKHIKGQHLGEKDNLCPVCGKEFIQKCHLARHMEVHRIDKPFVCTVCHRTYQTETKLRNHVGAKHSALGEKPFSCDICGKKFCGRSAVVYHRRVHTDERPHSCTLCPKSFVRPDGLKQHMKFHSGEKPFECEICQKKCTKRSGLNKHMKSHGKEQVGYFTCGLCNKSFSSASILNVHKRVHSGEKSFKCNTCDKSYRYEDSLKKHQRIHTEEQPHVCKQCGSSFTQINDLNEHLKTHIIKCHFCAEVFENSTDLQLHLVNIHGVIIPSNAVIDSQGTINIVFSNAEYELMSTSGELKDSQGFLHSDQFIQLHQTTPGNVGNVTGDIQSSDLLLNLRPTIDLQNAVEIVAGSNAESEVVDTWNITYLTSSEIPQF